MINEGMKNTGEWKFQGIEFSTDEEKPAEAG